MKKLLLLLALTSAFAASACWFPGWPPNGDTQKTTADTPAKTTQNQPAAGRLSW